MREIILCQESPPGLQKLCNSKRSRALTMSLGPMVAALGGTAHTSPDAPMGANREFSQMVSGISVVRRDPNLQRICLELLHARINESGVSRPARCGINDIGAAIAAFCDNIGVNIIALVFIGKYVPLLKGRTKVFPDPVIEMVQE